MSGRKYFVRESSGLKENGIIPAYECVQGIKQYSHTLITDGYILGNVASGNLVIV